MNALRMLTILAAGGGLLLGASCRHDNDAAGDGHGHGHAHDPRGGPAAEPWSVTAWGEQFEIFAETDALRAGETAQARVHVTIVDGFRPLTEGTVSVVLRSDGAEASFAAPRPSRPGIYLVDVAPGRPGTFELVYRVAAAGTTEEIPAGRVRVGDAGAPGGLDEEGQDEGAGTLLPFLKEQQWSTTFATARAAAGELAATVIANGRVLPAGGADVTITAPVPGAVSARRWPHVGAEVRPGATLFHLVPSVAGDRSLPELEAQSDELQAERDAAGRRLARLEGLASVGATSTREVEDARARLAGLEARLDAAMRTLATARAARGGGRAGSDALEVRSPQEGRVAEVFVTPGEVVGAGARLARVVQTRPVWIEVGLSPADASRVAMFAEGLSLRTRADAGALSLRPDEVALVARSPVLDPASGTVPVLVSVRRSTDELPIGSTVSVELPLGSASRSGVLLPGSAIVDDGGVSVVYEQVEGEAFARREVQVLVRRGERVLVQGLVPDARVVTVGGNAIRRAALMSSGAVEGHVH